MRFNHLSEFFRSRLPGNVAEEDIPPQVAETLAYYHNEKDTELNELSTPPSDEQVRIPAIWAFEIYTPTSINQLWEGAATLGWLDDDGTVSNRGISEFIEGIRSRSSGGGWINVGYLVKEKKIPSPSHRVAPLPENIKAIRACILQPVPSTTVLICQFYLDESASISLDESLRSTYSTTVSKDGGWYQYNTVEIEKQKSVETTRAYLRSICTQWIADHIPGYFCSKYSAFGDLPTCEFITLAKGLPFASLEFPSLQTMYTYLRMLRLDKDYHVLTSEDAEGLYFQFFDVDKSHPGRAVISGNIDAILTKQSLNHYGKDREGQILNWMKYLDHTLGAWVLHVICCDFQSNLSMLRDDYGNVDLQDIEKAFVHATELEQKLLYIQRNVVPFAIDIKTHCDSGLFMHEVYRMFRQNNRRGAKQEVFNRIRESIAIASDHILATEEQLRAVAMRMSQVLSSESPLVF